MTTEWMRGYREGGVNMINDVLYNANLYILSYVYRFELSLVMDIARKKRCVLLLLQTLNSSPRLDCSRL